jgi:TonB family protein
MKKIIFSSLAAILLLSAFKNHSFQNQSIVDHAAIKIENSIKVGSFDKVAVFLTLQEDTTVYSFVSIKNPPKYPGGMADFYDFLSDNIKYPQEASAKNITGNVHVGFIVEKDGSLSNIKIQRKLGYGTDEEAIRVLKLSKKWIPGMQNGKPVRVQYNIPIKFSMRK